MKKILRPWAIGVACGLSLGLAVAAPVAIADTGQATTTVSDLTSLGTLAVAVQGQADSTFQQQEQQYQGSLTGTSAWRGFSHQGSRTITVTFPKAVDVTGMKINALQNPSLGVYFPKYVEFDFEQNGKWYTAGARSSAIPLSEQKTMTQTFSWNNAEGVEATAVRFTIPVDVWVFVNGLDIQGSTTAKGVNANSLTPVTTTTTKSGPLSPSAPNDYGINNMLLVETGANGNSGLWSESDFEPMVAYEDESGKMTKPLFDTILFLPYGAVKDTVSGLTNYLNDLFKSGQQLSALNQAVAASNTALNRPGYKEKVVLSIPYFAYGNSDFGTVNGTDINFAGSSSDPNGVQAREAAEQWYLNQLISRWQSANFSNLQLVGLYWDEEQYRETMPGEEQMVQFAVDEAKSVNLPLFWIPYYGAGGVWDWKQLGFTAAWIQPNYVEQGENANLQRMTSAANTAISAGLGIEIELAGIDSASQQLYDNSLAQLSADGLGENQVSHAYYDGSKLLLTSAESTGSERIAYNTTASFINGGNLNAAQ